MAERQSLEHYLKLQYPFHVTADPDGGYVINFPDLPGCLTQVETAAEIGPMAEDARQLWIETEYEEGEDIPLPTYPEEYSGKFNVRLPRSLHRRLVEGAECDGVSLNQYVVALLSRGEAEARQASSSGLSPEVLWWANAKLLREAVAHGEGDRRMDIWKYILSSDDAAAEKMMRLLKESETRERER